MVQWAWTAPAETKNSGIPILARGAFLLASIWRGDAILATEAVAIAAVVALSYSNVFDFLDPHTTSASKQDHASPLNTRAVVGLVTGKCETLIVAHLYVIGAHLKHYRMPHVSA